jgi:hypothetical protein
VGVMGNMALRAWMLHQGGCKGRCFDSWLLRMLVVPPDFLPFNTRQLTQVREQIKL